MKPYSIREKQNREILLKGMKDGIPIALGYLAVSFSLGIAAKNAGLDCITVLWGFRDKDYLVEKGAAVFAETAQELLAEILG